MINECYIILQNLRSSLELSEFRLALQQLGKLIYARTQLMLLTATLSLITEQTLFKRISYTQEEIRLFRAQITQSNIQYLI